MLVARADADAALDQMLLEILHIIRRRCLWWPAQPCRKTLTRAQVAGLWCRSTQRKARNERPIAKRF